MNEEEKQRYNENPDHCPYCGSTSIEGGTPQADGKEAWVPVVCMECSQEWHDVYTFSTIEEV